MREGGDDWQDPVHPRRRPRTIGRKKPLHVHAEVNTAFRQRKIGAGRSSGLTRCRRLHTRSSHVQKNGLAVRDHDPISRETKPLLSSAIVNDLGTGQIPPQELFSPPVARSLTERRRLCSVDWAQDNASVAGTTIAALILKR